MEEPDVIPSAKGSDLIHLRPQVSRELAAIIPTWNRADLLRGVLTNLRSQTRPPDELIVVDNGSTDPTGDVAREFGATLISLANNQGFAGAVNAGIARSRSDWILIINNDVELQPRWIELVLKAVEIRGADFAAGKLLQATRSGHIDGTWDLISRGAHAWRCGYGRPDGALWSTEKRVQAVPMTAALFKRRVFERVGLLDERFEAYYEDVDFGIRCALAGLAGVYEPAAVASHLGKGTLGKNSARVLFLTARNQIFLLAKHFSRRTLARFAWPVLVAQSLSLIGAARQGHLWAALRGMAAGARRWRSFRSEPRPDPTVTEHVLAASEREIFDLQDQLGFDPYWRLYFSLVRSQRPAAADHA